MSKKAFSRVLSGAAHVHNPQATALAREINQGAPADATIRDAIAEAQVHRDWSRLAALENSLERVTDRTVARRLQNVGGRALVVSRLDGGALASEIPEGFQYGLAWLVCLVFVRVDPVVEVAYQIGDAFLERVTEVGGLGVDWGPVSLCVPTLAFGPPARLALTDAAARNDHDRVFDVQRWAEGMINAEVDASSSDQSERHPVSYVIWGTVVSGTHSPVTDLLDEAVWCPGFDKGAIEEQATRLLAEIATEFDGDTFIHPEVLSADEAHDFARQMSREQTVHHIVHNVLADQRGADLTSSVARLSMIIPDSVPYMDQILIGFWGPCNVLLHTFRFPRSDRPLEDDVERVAQLCRDAGIGKVEVVDLKERIGANDASGCAVDAHGNLVEASRAGVGDAYGLVRSPWWPELDVEILRTRSGTQRLPSVLCLQEMGALRVLSEHYTPSAWKVVEASLGRVGDPSALIPEALRGVWDRPMEDFESLVRHMPRLLIPERNVALAAQFKMCGGPVVVATPALLALLAETDIGGDCQGLFMRAGFPSLYLSLRVPALSLDVPDDASNRCYIDGILVQNWSVDGGERLQLDVFLTTGKDVNEPDSVVGVSCLSFRWSDDVTLKELRDQVLNEDETLLQALDLYAGVMLYMGSRDARVVKREDRTLAMKTIAQLNRKKRRKVHYDAANSSVDAIHVGPEVLSAPDQAVLSKGSGGTKSPHYRRGYVKPNQPWGKGRALRRPVFIPPVLVNAHKLASGAVPKKRYQVGPEG